MKLVFALLAFPLAVSPLLEADAATALRAGLGPEALACAGASASDTSTAVADLAGSDGYTGGDLEAADASYRNARGTADKLQRLIKSGKATDEQVQEYQTAKTDLATAEAAVQSALDALFTAGTTNLSASEKTILTQIRANASRRGFPTELLTVSRTDQEWMDLNKALAHEKVCLEKGEGLHTDVVTLLATVRGDGTVATAKANLDANLVAIQAAWDAATD